MASIAQSASNSANAPPNTPSNALSVSIWRINRQRPAPSAARTASSFSRPAERASCRLATLAQAMSRTQPTAPSNSNRL